MKKLDLKKITKDDEIEFKNILLYKVNKKYLDVLKRNGISVNNYIKNCFYNQLKKDGYI